MGADADPDRLAARGGHWLLARRKVTDPSEIAYYVCHGPRRSTLLDLAWIARVRQRIEECSQQAKNRGRAGSLPGPILAGVVCPHRLGRARSRVARHGQISCHKRGICAAEPHMIGFTLPEIRRLLAKLILRVADAIEHAWS